MSIIGTIAAQGLAFQSTRLAMAAANIVNAGLSTPASADGTVLGAVYQPRDVTGISLEGGGVRAAIVARNPATVRAADQRSPTGFSAMPATDLAREMVTLMSAQNSYQAALRLLAVDSELSRALLDATA